MKSAGSQDDNSSNKNLNERKMAPLVGGA